MRRIAFLPVALAAAVAVGCSNPNRTNAATNAIGSDSSAVGTTGASDITRVRAGDKDFVHDIGIANTAEIELGKMAVERASSADVKKFGQMMIDDHTKAGETLRMIASQDNIPVPDQLDEKHRELREKLAGLKGTEFDRQYMSAMVDGHETVLDKLESRTDKTELANWKARRANPATGRKEKVGVETVTVVPEKSENAVTMSINQWAADAYPVVYAHLEAAKDANAGIKKRMTH
jgi:putative membrane protein